MRLFIVHILLHILESAASGGPTNAQHVELTDFNSTQLLRIREQSLSVSRVVFLGHDVESGVARRADLLITIRGLTYRDNLVAELIKFLRIVIPVLNVLLQISVDRSLYFRGA
jgi:hypothetical protein